MNIKYFCSRRQRLKWGRSHVMFFYSSSPPSHFPLPFLTFLLPFTRLLTLSAASAIQKQTAEHHLTFRGWKCVFFFSVFCCFCSFSLKTCPISCWRSWGLKEPWRWVRSTLGWRALEGAWHSAPLWPSGQPSTSSSLLVPAKPWLYVLGHYSSKCCGLWGKM